MPSIAIPDEPLDRCCPRLCLYFVTEVVSLPGCENAGHSRLPPGCFWCLTTSTIHTLKTALFLSGKLASEAIGWSRGRMEVLAFLGDLSPRGSSYTGYKANRRKAENHHVMEHEACPGL